MTLESLSTFHRCHICIVTLAGLAEVREGVQQLSDSLCAAVERLASDLYESECHFLYEIIQNLGCSLLMWAGIHEIHIT